MRSAIRSGLFVAAAVALSGRSAVAQDPSFERIQVTRVVVKPGKMDAWVAAVKRVNEARAKVKDPVGRTYWQVGRGGPPRTFLVAVRFDKWGSLEDWTSNGDVLTKAFGEGESLRITDALGDATESAETEILTVWKGMNSWKDGAWGYAWVTESQVRPAAIPQWEQQVAARAAAARRSPSWPPTVRYRTSLGRSGRFVTARFFDKWSDVDGWPELKDVVGAAEADKIDALARGGLESGSNYIMRRRTDLSYVPAP